MKEYKEEEFLLLSGIQHFCFCRRQWALIHIEQQWRENLKTTEGNIVHEHCHDEKFNEKRNDLLITRGLRVFSKKLGISGQCDVVEFTKATEGAFLAKYGGFWSVCPIEYKRGKAKIIDADRLQLCCQAMCLEEMLACSIEYGYLYYHETHRRERIDFTTTLRESAETMLKEMHQYYSRGYTPKVKVKVGCKSCSLAEVCVPAICKNISVSSYYDRFISEENDETVAE